MTPDQIAELKRIALVAFASGPPAEDEFLDTFDPPAVVALFARIEALEAERDAAMSLAAATKERCDHAEALWRAARAEGPAPPGGGGAPDHSSVGFCAEAQSPSPSDGPVLRHVESEDPPRCFDNRPRHADGGPDRWTCDGEWHRGWSGHDPFADRCPNARKQP